ncbi:hypothetical protein HK405_013809, partial [Cladochytrium tenue]
MASSATLACRCLNVRINCAGPAFHPAPAVDLQSATSGGPISADQTFDTAVPVTLKLGGVSIEHSVLTRALTAPSGFVTVTCLNCETPCYAVAVGATSPAQVDDRPRVLELPPVAPADGSKVIYVTDSLLRGEELRSAFADPALSEVFKILVPDTQPVPPTGFSSVDGDSRVLEGLQSRLTNWTKLATTESEERIAKFRADEKRRLEDALRRGLADRDQLWGRIRALAAEPHPTATAPSLGTDASPEASGISINPNAIVYPTVASSSSASLSDIGREPSTETLLSTASTSSLHTAAPPQNEEDLSAAPEPAAVEPMSPQRKVHFAEQPTAAVASSSSSAAAVGGENAEPEEEGNDDGEDMFLLDENMPARPEGKYYDDDVDDADQVDVPNPTKELAQPAPPPPIFLSMSLPISVPSNLRRRKSAEDDKLLPIVKPPLPDAAGGGGDDNADLAGGAATAATAADDESGTGRSDPDFVAPHVLVAQSYQGFARIGRP